MPRHHLLTVPHPIVRSLAADGPMLPTLVDGLPRREGWRFEPKWDGWRALAVLEDGRADLRSRRATDLAPCFPELTRPPVALAGRRAVLDGEVVVLRNGRPDFDAISGRLAARRLADWAAHTDPATFVAFDVLELDGQALAEEPLHGPQGCAVAAHRNSRFSLTEIRAESVLRV